MSEQTTQKQRFMVSVYEQEEAGEPSFSHSCPGVFSRNVGLGASRSACRNSSSRCARRQVS